MGAFLYLPTVLSHYAFRALPFEDRLKAIWAEGTFLATRWEEEDAVNLYHMGTFFAEVYYDPESNEMLRTGAPLPVGGAWRTMPCMSSSMTYLYRKSLGWTAEAFSIE